MKIVVLLLALSMASTAQNYTAQRTSDHGVAIIRLTDAANGVDVSIVPSIGNRAYEMNVHGKNILYFPSADVGEFQKRPELSGIPFLAPWANRLNEQGFWANGKKYTFNYDTWQCPRFSSHSRHAFKFAPLGSNGGSSRPSIRTCN
jgi:aldose 1-epimerase